MAIACLTTAHIPRVRSQELCRGALDRKLAHATFCHLPDRRHLRGIQSLTARRGFKHVPSAPAISPFRDCLLP